MENSLEVILERTRWFRQARFGMFIHFGLYAIPGRGEWIRSNEKMTNPILKPLILQNLMQGSGQKLPKRQE